MRNFHYKILYCFLLLSAFQVFVANNLQAQNFDESSTDLELEIEPSETYTQKLPLDTSFIAEPPPKSDAIRIYPQLKNDPYMLDYTFLGGTLNWKRLGNNTLLVGATSVVAMFALYLAPENFTNWKKDELHPNKIFGKWWRNVSGGLVIDHDDLFLNWVAHPYFGAVYYMTARSAGFNGLLSFSYSFIMSTFFWEMGIESLAERPSLQDVIITPGIGSIFGELFYVTKRAVVANDYKLGCKFVGHLYTFLIDPLNEIMDCIQGTWHKKNPSSHVSLAGYTSPYFSADGKHGLNFRMQLSF